MLGKPAGDGQIGMDTVGRPSILVSAFEPFGGAGVNASQEVAQRLDGLMLANGATIETLVVPVVAGEAERIVFEQLRNRPRPLAYIALGEAGPERVVRLEKVAINWDFFSIPDNAGNQFRDQAIVASGPDAYFATLPFANLHTDFDKSLAAFRFSYRCLRVRFCAIIWPTACRIFSPKIHPLPHRLGLFTFPLGVPLTVRQIYKRLWKPCAALLWAVLRIWSGT